MTLKSVNLAEETVRNMLFVDHVLRNSKHLGHVTALLANSPPVEHELQKLRARDGAQFE